MYIYIIYTTVLRIQVKRGSSRTHNFLLYCLYEMLFARITPGEMFEFSHKFNQVVKSEKTWQSSPTPHDYTHPDHCCCLSCDPNPNADPSRSPPAPRQGASSMAKKKRSKSKRAKPGKPASRGDSDLPENLDLCSLDPQEVDLTQLQDATESRQLLRYLTRLLYVSVLLSGAVVMAVSLLLLFKCRREVRGMEEAVDCGHGHCSSQSLPAYFVLLVLFVVTFGLGCVGRRVTGALLVVVSLAAVAVAAAAAVTQHCLDDLALVHGSLLHKLQQCGLLYRAHHSSSNASSSSPSSSSSSAGSGENSFSEHFHRFQELPVGSPHTEVCRVMAGNFDLVCSEHVTWGQPVSDARLVACAQHVAAKLHALCAQDAEVVLPVLVTVPIFYIFVGLGFVLIKHADNRMSLRRGSSSSSSWHGGYPVRSQGTSTRQLRRPSADFSSSSTFSTRGPACRRFLASCLQSLFNRSPWCFACYVKGHPCRCCPAFIARSTSSRQSFTHMEDKDQAEAEAALHVPLRTAQSQERNERKYLMEQSV